jgi:hypothetical protein
LKFDVYSPNGRKSFSLGLTRFPERLPQVKPVICRYPERVESSFNRLTGRPPAAASGAGGSLNFNDQYNAASQHSKAGLNGGSYWLSEPSGETSAVAKAMADKAVRHAAVPCGEHATGEAEVSAQEPTLVAGFYGQTVLQRRVLA